MTTFLLNSTVIPSGADGIWQARTIPLQEAKAIALAGFTSAIGHESTANLMTTILGITVPINRIQVSPEPGDRFLCFKLKKRAPEGVILSQEELEELGYEWVVMDYYGNKKAIIMEPVSVDDDLPEDGQWVWHCFKGVRHWQYGQYFNKKFHIYAGPISEPATHWVTECVLPELVGEDESEED